MAWLSRHLLADFPTSIRTKPSRPIRKSTFPIMNLSGAIDDGASDSLAMSTDRVFDELFLFLSVQQLHHPSNFPRGIRLTGENDHDSQVAIHGDTITNPDGCYCAPHLIDLYRPIVPNDYFGG